LDALPLIDWFAENFDIKILYLLRHPIPVSLSIINRGWKTIAEAFLRDSRYVSNYLDKRLERFSWKILRYGTSLEKYALEWCLYHLPPLSLLEREKWLPITYEELVLKPRAMIDLLCKHLCLKNREHMLEVMSTPSKTTSKQSIDTIKTSGSFPLVSNWRQKIKKTDEISAMNVLKEFGLSAYEEGRVTASKELCHFSV
jgi:hypothetical protein